MKTLAAEIDRIGRIDAAAVLRTALGSVRAPGGGLRKVEEDESGKNFLKDQFRFFGMEMDHPYRILQLSEGGLDSPAPGVKLFQNGRRELLRFQVGDECLHAAVGYRQENFDCCDFFWNYVQRVQNGL